MFVRLRNWVADAAAGVKIRADYHDIEDDGFADGLSQCIVKDGQTTVMQNIPFNSKRITALQDPVDLQDAATKAYADLKLPLTGGTITGDLNVTGKIGALGYKTRPGMAGAFGTNVFNFNYTSSNLEAWIDNTNLGLLATQAYVETRAAAWAHAIADPKVNRAGDTMTGGLTVNGELVAAAGYLRFGSSGSPGYIIWQGGPSYGLGGGGTIWHTGNITPITNGRLAMATDQNPSPDVGLYEYSGCVMTGIALTGAAKGVSGVRWRYMQLLTPNGWFTVSYA
jgi:hypothetical protein